MVRDPASDADLQNEQIRELINEGVQAVFLCPVDWEKITPALEALKEADIPVINLDTEVKETSLVSAFVGSDNENAGICVRAGSSGPETRWRQNCDCGKPWGELSE